MKIIESDISTDYLDWNGLRIEILYEHPWHRYADVALLQVKAEDHQPLPITETGYLAHFVNPDDVDTAGGRVAYTKAWLDEAADSPEWQKLVERRLQRSFSF